MVEAPEKTDSSETEKKRLELAMKTIALVRPLNLPNGEKDILIIAIGNKLFPESIPGYVQNFGVTEEQIKMCSRAVAVNPKLKAFYEHVVSLVNESPIVTTKIQPQESQTPTTTPPVDHITTEINNEGNRNSHVIYEAQFVPEMKLKTRQKLIVILNEHYVRFPQISVNYQTIADYLGLTRQAVHQTAKKDERFPEELAEHGLILEKVGHSAIIRSVGKQT